MSSLDTQPSPSLEDLKFLVEVSQLLTLLDLNSMMQRVISLTSSAVGSTRSSLILREDDQIDWNHMLLTRQLGPDESVVVVRAVMDEGLAGWVTANRRGAIVRNTQHDPRWHVFPEEEDPAGSALCVPFIDGDEVIAILTLVHPEPDHFNEHDLRLVTIVANQATLALRNAQLFQRVQSQQRQLEVVLHAIPDILLVLDLDGTVLMANDPAHGLFGDDRALVGRSIFELAADDSVLAPIGRILNREPYTGEPWSFEAHSDATGRDFHITMSLWENSAAGTRGYIAVLHDVTTLRDLHRFKDEMLKMVTHDLRNPVALIASALDMLEMDLESGQPAPPEVPQYLDIIKSSTDRMNEMLDNLLSVETSSRVFVDPGELIETSIAVLRPMVASKGQSIQADLDLEEITQILIDPLLIREAIENYISNAIKYTPPGGQIVVRAYTADERFCFAVIDNGIGISTADQAQVFEPYFRADRPETLAEDGHGVGLSLVKTIIERHKGGVWVDSIEGSGSTFGFWLPL